MSAAVEQDTGVRTIAHWIDGRPTTGASSERGIVTNPATGAPSGHVAFAGRSEVDDAVTAAAAASPGWADRSIPRRTNVLFRFRELLTSHTDDLARVITREHGKTVDDARGEVRRGIEVVEFACGVEHLLKGDMSENVSTDVDAYSLRQPLGVVAGITPFNFPAMVPMWMFPLALACGNTFVLKPSEQDPTASVLLAEWLSAAGLPDGVFNVVHGDRTAVDALLAHPDVAAISFVGSTPVARHVHETGTRSHKRVQALGGAKNHAVVLPDADIAGTADALVSAGYGSAGERCMAISAVVTVGSVRDELLSELADRTSDLVVGPGTDPDVQMGPLVSAEHLARVRGLVDQGVDEGASLLVDGRGLVVDHAADGFFLGPCLFSDVTTDMSIYTEEIFGPVLSVLHVDDLDDALRLVRRNPYGNGAAVFTRSGRVAREFQHRVDAGMVGINVPIPVPTAAYPFGGWKNSLFGDRSVYGTEGIGFYTRTKAVTARWPEASDGLELDFPA